MVKRPDPKNFTNFRTYANTLRRWYLNKPYNVSTNRLTSYQQWLANYFQVHGSSSSTNIGNIVNREVEKLFKVYSGPMTDTNRNRMANKLGPSWYEKPPVYGRYGGLDNLRRAKNIVRRRTSNEISARTLMKKFNTINLNTWMKYLNKVWVPTGKKKGWNLPMVRKPTGHVMYMNKKGEWQPFPARPNVFNYENRKYKNYGTNQILNPSTIWTNNNGTQWAFMNGQWVKLKVLKYNKNTNTWK